MPAARHLSFSPLMALAVRAMMGVVRPSLLAQVRVASKPSITGICTSIRIRSKRCLRTHVNGHLPVFGFGHFDVRR